MTKTALIELRRSSYKAPDLPQPRCETCEHHSTGGNHCLAIEIRGRIMVFKVHPLGVCDLWKERERP